MTKEANIRLRRRASATMKRRGQSPRSWAGWQSRLLLFIFALLNLFRVGRQPAAFVFYRSACNECLVGASLGIWENSPIEFGQVTDANQ